MEPAFVWADLSTHDFPAARRFYADVFGWRCRDVGDAYHVGACGGMPVAGLYPMPEKFLRIQMPSFWMSYLRVGALDAVVAAAEAHGGRVEVRPEPAPGGGRIALIRDPAGAGFTCYEGDELGGGASTGEGRRAWHELHVSDAAAIEGFYRAVFGWDFQPAEQPGRFTIHTADGNVVAGLQVTPNELKGDKEYWGVYFAVADLEAARRRIMSAGGRVEADQPLGDREAVLAYDSQGAAFYVVADPTDVERDSVRPGAVGSLRWRAILGLVVVALAVLFEWDWMWGVLFLLWVIPDLRSGHVHFMEPVDRRRNPVVYWLIVLAWVTLSLYFFVP